MVNKMLIQRVKIAPQIDGIEALYIDGKLETQGDEYHDDINAYLNGFIACIKKIEFPHSYEEYELPMEEEELNYEWITPENFSELPLKRMKKIK